MLPSRALIVAIVLLVWPHFTHAQTPEELIRQLGSDSFVEREQAARALEQLGEKAVPWLEKQRTGSDLETQRRSAQLLERIENRLLAESVLVPRPIRFHFEKTTLRDVLNQLQREHGFQIQHAATEESLHSRLSIDTGEVPFWTAWDHLLAKSGFTNAVLRHPVYQAPGLISNGWWSVRTVQIGQPEKFADRGNTVVDQSRAVRVRGQIFDLRERDSAPKRAMVLEVFPDPRLRMLNMDRIRIDEITWKGEAPWKPSTPLEFAPIRRVVADPKEEEFVTPAQSEARQEHGKLVLIRLPDAKSTQLASVRGRAQLEFMVEFPLIRIPSLQDAVGKTFSHPRGVFIKVLGHRITEEGDLEIRLLTPSRDHLTSIGLSTRFERLRSGTIIRRDPATVLASQLDVRDADGYAWMRDDVQTIDADNGDVQLQIRYRGRPDARREFQLRLDMRGVRVVAVEMPFELK